MPIQLSNHHLSWDLCTTQYDLYCDFTQVQLLQLNYAFDSEAVAMPTFDLFQILTTYIYKPLTVVWREEIIVITIYWTNWSE